jgi:hypothetical protein
LEAVRRRDTGDRDAERDRERDAADRPTVREPKPQSGWSLAFSRSNLRVRISITILTSLVGALVMVCTHLWTYVKGINVDNGERDAALSEVRAVREQLDEHEARMATMVVGYKADLERSDKALRILAHVQLLQWSYVTTVVEAAQKRKPIPGKPPALVEAETKAAIALRDQP